MGRHRRIPRASRRQHCLLFNPTRLDSACFNPLLEVRKGPREIRDVQNIVEMLVNPDGSKRRWTCGTRTPASSSRADPARALHRTGRSKSIWGGCGNSAGFQQHLQSDVATPASFRSSTGPEVHPEIARVAGSLLTQADRFRSSVRGTAEGVSDTVGGWDRVPR